MRPAHYSRGHKPETIDPNPVEMPGAGYKKPETLESIVARLLKTREIDKALNEGTETPEEADDFELEDPDMSLDMTPYELPEVIPESPESYEQLDPVPDPVPDGAAVAEPSVEAPADAESPKGDDA